MQTAGTAQADLGTQRANIRVAGKTDGYWVQKDKQGSAAIFGSAPLLYLA